MIFKVMKFLAAGLTAAVLLCVILAFYTLLPVHISNPRGNTDYIWPSGSVYFKTSEGIGWGRFDENGFNNASVVDSPDILVLGSSHMEATNVRQDESATAVLNDILGNRLGGGSTWTAYNEGISGHNIYKSSQYLDESLSQFNIPPKYVVIETSTVSITEEMVAEVINHGVEFVESHSTGLIATLQRLPFFRIIYMNLKNGLLERILPELYSSSTSADDDDGLSLVPHENALDTYFEYISSVSEKYGTKVIIVYHSRGTIEKDGSLVFSDNPESDDFATKASEYGVYYIDLTEAFLEEYAVNHHVPHGFETGKLGIGHLNRYGHRVFAKEVAALIISIEEADV